MSKLDIIALSGVVYKVNNTDPREEPCGTPYETMFLSDRGFLFLKESYLNKKKTKFEPAQICHTI